MGESLGFVEKVLKFNEIAGNDNAYDRRKLCLYIGLVLEETEELIEAFLNDREEIDLLELSSSLKKISQSFKEGSYDSMADFSNAVEIADAGTDIAVVALGTVMSNGFDVLGCVHEVADSNLSKFETDDGTWSVLKDENGKVKKGPKYFKPNLAKYQLTGTQNQ